MQYLVAVVVVFVTAVACSFVCCTTATVENLEWCINLTYSSFTIGQWVNVFHFFATSWDSINDPEAVATFRTLC